MGVETGSHIPLGIGCTLILATAVPFAAIPACLPVVVVKPILGISETVKSPDSLVGSNAYKSITRVCGW